MHPPSYNYNSLNYNTVPLVLNDQDSWSANVNYNPRSNAVPTVFGTDQDVQYLEAALQLRLRVNNVSVAVPDPEYILYVLVDVLGTNRSKQDQYPFLEGYPHGKLRAHILLSRYQDKQSCLECKDARVPKRPIRNRASLVLPATKATAGSA